MTDEFEEFGDPEEEKPGMPGQTILIAASIFIITFLIGILGGCTVGLIAVLGMGGRQ